MERCEQCRFFSALESVCRKNPPVVFPVAQPTGVASFGLFPPTKDSNWCGAFELRREP
jgi:hypothetical protein